MSELPSPPGPARPTRNGPRTYLTFSVIGAFLITRFFLLLFHLHHGPSLTEYRGWLQQATAGRIPFVDFPIEFPPVAWWVMRLPGTTNQSLYDFRFRLVMGLGDIGSFCLLWWIVSKRRPRMSVLVAAVYVITTVLLEYVLYDSLDMLMLLSVLAALSAWLHAPESTRPALWRAVAYAAVGLGASYKVIPIIVLPFLVLGDWRTERRSLPVALRLGLCVAVLAAPFVLSYRQTGLASLGFLRYHAVRGVEIGSTWATLMWSISRTDNSLRVVGRFGSWELVGSLESMVLRMASLSAVLVMVGLGFWALALKGRFDVRRTYLHALLAMLGMLLVSKVFSVQYLLWAIPLVMLAAIELTTDRWLLVISASCIAMAGLTTVFYPLGMRHVEGLNGWIMTVQAIRNGIYAALSIWLVRLAFEKDRTRRTGGERRGNGSAARETFR